MCGRRPKMEWSPDLASPKATHGRHQRARGGGDLLLVSPSLHRRPRSNLTLGPLISIFHPLSHLNFTQPTSTQLNSTQLKSLFDPPGPPFWSLLGTQIDPRSAPSRLLTPYFLKKIHVHEMHFRPNENPFCDPKTPPGTIQDRPKTAPRRS